MPEGQDRQSLELALLVAKANALLPLKGYSAPETVAALTRGEANSSTLGSATTCSISRCFMAFARRNTLRRNWSPARALAQQFVDLADRQDDPIYRLVGHRLLGTVEFFMGRNREALEMLQQAETYRDPPRQKQLSYRFGYDPGLTCFVTRQ